MRAKTIRLTDGSAVTLRSERTTDKQMEAEMFTRFSVETQRLRYFTRIKDVRRFLTLYHGEDRKKSDIGVVAQERIAGGARRILAVSHLFADPNGRTAEFAIVVADPWQRLGLGGILMDHMLTLGKAMHLKTIYAYVLADNAVMITMMKKRGFTFEAQEDMLLARLTLTNHET